MTVRDYVDTLTPEEREQFKDLIAESFAREQAIEQSASEARATVVQLDNDLYEIWVRLALLKRQLDTIRETALETYIRVAPTPKITH